MLIVKPQFPHLYFEESSTSLMGLLSVGLSYMEAPFIKAFNKHLLKERISFLFYFFLQCPLLMHVGEVCPVEPHPPACLG